MAIEDVSLEVARGEIFALLGPNGAGKTTTLRLLAGLIAPSAGTVVFDGAPVTRRTASRLRARVGFLTEAPGLWERLTVRANLLVYARLHGLPDPPAAVDRSLDTFGLSDRADSLAGELSKGMKQKLALARALIHDPVVALLDEPTGGLDPQTARIVREMVLQLRREGRAILISTHNLDEAERMADRVGILERRLLAVDAPAALARRFFGRRVRIACAHDVSSLVDVARSAGGSDVRADGAWLSIALDDPDMQTPELVRRLVTAGADIREVSLEKTPLEEVYLKLIATKDEASPVGAGLRTRPAQRATKGTKE